jgi:hypothetical protein
MTPIRICSSVSRADRNTTFQPCFADVPVPLSFQSSDS